MSQATPSPEALPSNRSSVSLLRIVVVALIGGAVAWAVYYYMESTQGAKTIPPVDTVQTMRVYLDSLAKQQRLADEYRDEDGDLLADPPKDAAEWLNPETLEFTVVATDNPGAAEATWKPFLDHLAKATGKSVVYAKRIPGAPMPEPIPESEAVGPDPGVWTTDAQVEALKQGTLHVTAFNTGQVVTAINTAGFQPLYAPATAEGSISAYTMQMIVPTESSINSIADISNKKVALVAMSSNSGGKAPLAFLKENNLTPGKDYNIVFTGDHRRSIRELVNREHDVACVASDLLEQMVEQGEIESGRYRVIYTSPAFPPLVFGVPHRLHPDLRNAIEQAFESFQFAGTPIGELYQAQKRTQFARIRYARDFATVRDVDAKLLSLMNLK